MQENIPDMVFVVGNSRSGTTMLGRILNKSRDIFTFNELHFFEQLWSADERGKALSIEAAQKLLCKLIKIQRMGYLKKADPNIFLSEAASLLLTLQPSQINAENIFRTYIIAEAKQKSKNIPCDQTPRNIFYIKDLLEIFPESKFINIVRDPRDILLSQKNKWKRKFLGAAQIPLRESIRSFINYHPVTISKLWASCISAGNSVANDPRVFTLRFEDIVKDPQNSVKKICSFLNIDFEIEMLEIPQVGSSTGLDRPEVKGINEARSQNWMKGGLDSAEIFLCQWIAKKEMAIHNYQHVEVKPSYFKIAMYMFIFPLKIFSGFLLNIGRMKNIRDSLYRRFGIKLGVKSLVYENK